MPNTKRTLTPAQVEAQFVGGHRLAPGIWIDKDENLHFSVPDILGSFGWPDDPAHREMVDAIIRECVQQEFPDSTICDTDIES